MDYEKKVYARKEGLSMAMFELKGEESFSENVIKRINGKVLDVGCGAGSLIGWLKKERPDLDIYAVDISKNAIKVAKKDFPSIHFSVSDTYNLPFPDNFFDVAIMCGVIEHLEYPERALVELRRVLKMGGVFFSTTPVEGEKLALNLPRRLSEKYLGHLQRFSRKSLISLFNKHNLIVEKYYFKGFLLQELINILHVYLFELLKLPRDFSTQSYVIGEKRSVGKFIVGIIRKIAFYLIILETKLRFYRIPGASIHIIAHKLPERG